MINSSVQISFKTLYYNMLLHLSLILTWVSSPVLSVLPIFLYLFFFSVSKGTRNFYFFLLATIPALINATKTPVSDLHEYYYTYKSLYYIRIEYFFDEYNRDQLFYFISMLLSKGFDGENQVFIVFWTTLMYFITFLSLSLFAENLEKYNKKVLIGTIFYTLLIGVSFTNSGHLIRQYVANSMLILGVVLLINKKKKSIVLILFAFFSHWSTLIYIVAFILNMLKATKSNVFLLSLIAFSILIGSSNILNVLMPYLVGMSNMGNEVTIMADRAINYSDYKGDGSVGIRQLVLMFISSIFALLIYINEENEKVKAMLFFILFTLSIILITRNNPLLFLRYYFYFEFFFSFFFLIVISKYWHNQVIRVVFYGLMFIAPIKFIRSLEGSNWTYSDNGINIIFNSVFNLYSYLS